MLSPAVKAVKPAVVANVVPTLAVPLILRFSCMGAFFYFYVAVIGLDPHLGPSSTAPYAA